MWMMYLKGDGFEDTEKFYDDDEAMDAFYNYEEQRWVDPDVEYISLYYDGGYFKSRYTRFCDNERRVS